MTYQQREHCQLGLLNFKNYRAFRNGSPIALQNYGPLKNGDRKIYRLPYLFIFFFNVNSYRRF